MALQISCNAVHAYNLPRALRVTFITTTSTQCRLRTRTRAHYRPHVSIRSASSITTAGGTVVTGQDAIDAVLSQDRQRVEGAAARESSTIRKTNRNPQHPPRENAEQAQIRKMDSGEHQRQRREVPEQRPVERRTIRDSSPKSDPRAQPQIESQGKGLIKRLRLRSSQRPSQQPAKESSNHTQDFLEPAPRGQTIQVITNPLEWQRTMRSFATKRKNAHLNQNQAPLNPSDFKYPGRYIALPSSPAQIPQPFPWAVTVEEVAGMSGMQILEEELRRFEKFVTPTVAEHAARQAAMAEITELTAKQGDGILPADFELFGSQLSGLALATSDINIRISTTSKEDLTVRAEQLQDLAKKLSQNEGDYTEVEFRPGMFPVLVCQHAKSGVDFQLVSALPALRQAELQQQYLSELPHLRTLYTFMRVAVGTRGLAQTFYGGMSPYGLFMMLVAAMKQAPAEAQTLSQHLLHFLHFYVKLRRDKLAVLIEPPRFIKKTERVPDTQGKDDGDSSTIRKYTYAPGGLGTVDPNQPYLLGLQDPATRGKDIGYKTHAIKHLIATFDGMHRDLLEDLQSAEAAAGKGETWKGESVLLRAVGRYHEVEFERRQRMQEYGRQVMQNAEVGSQETEPVTGMSAA